MPEQILQPEREIVGWGWYYCYSFMVCVNQQPGSSLQVIFQKHLQGAGGQRSVLGKCLSLLLILRMLKREEMLLYGMIHKHVFLLGQAMLGGSREHGAKWAWTLLWPGWQKKDFFFWWGFVACYQVWVLAKNSFLLLRFLNIQYTEKNILLYRTLLLVFDHTKKHSSWIKQITMWCSWLREFICKEGKKKKSLIFFFNGKGNAGST